MERAAPRRCSRSHEVGAHGRATRRRALRRRPPRGARHPEASLGRAVGCLVLPLELLLWTGVAWYASEQLPPLETGRDAVLRVLATAFTAPLVSLGEGSYALRDLLALPAVLAALWIAVGVLARVLESRWRRIAGVASGGQATAGMLLRYALTFVGTLVVLQAWGVDVRALAIAGSVLGVGIGFGLQNLANNSVSGLVISLERPIKPGDYVRVGEFKGTVTRIGAASPADEDADRGFVHEAGRGTWSVEELRALVERMRNAADLPILDRRHRLRSYARCFLGREVVDWLVRYRGITRERAVAAGRLLVEHDLLHHVLDEHTFHDDGLFYRFRADD